jgi:hypothetical protein
MSRKTKLQIQGSFSFWYQQENKKGCGWLYKIFLTKLDVVLICQTYKAHYSQRANLDSHG